MMKYLLIFAIILFTISCTATNMEVVLKTDSEKTVIPNKDDEEKLLSLLKELVKNTDDMLKVYLGEERINNLKNNEHYLEFLFENKVNVSTDNFGKYNINKILIPLTGKLAPSEKSDRTTIILGDDSYISGPLRNADGYIIIKKMLAILEK